MTKTEQNNQIIAGTDHHPASSQKYDDTEDVDHAWCKHAIPSAKQDRLRDEEISFPPRLAVRRLQTSGNVISSHVEKSINEQKIWKKTASEFTYLTNIDTQALENNSGDHKRL